MKHCMLTKIKVYACYTVKIYTTQTLFFKPEDAPNGSFDIDQRKLLYIICCFKGSKF